MLLKIKYDPATLFTEIFNVISLYFNATSEIKLEQLYAQSGFSTDTHVFQAGQQLHNYKDAYTFCTAANMDLFAPSSDMTLKQLLDELNTDALWTQYTQSEITKQIVGRNHYPAVKATNDTTIRLEVMEVLADHAIALKRDKSINDTWYASVDRTEKLTSLCMKELDFPKKAKDLSKLVDIQNRILSNLNSSKELMQMYKGQVDRQRYAVPDLGNLTHMKRIMVDSIELDAQSKVQKIVKNQLSSLVNPIAKIFKNVNSYVDFSDLVILDNNFHDTVKALGPLIAKPLEYPITQLPWEQRGKFNARSKENQKIHMARAYDDTHQYLLVQLFGTKEKALLPLKFSSSQNHTALDTARDSFYEITLPDVVLSMFWLINFLIAAFSYSRSTYSEFKRKGRSKKMRKRGKQDSSQKGFELKKIWFQRDSSSDSQNTEAQPRVNQIRETEEVRMGECCRGPERSQLKKIRKYRAPEPPRSLRYKNRTPYSSTTLVTTIRNSDLPVHLGDSMLSLDDL